MSRRYIGNGKIEASVGQSILIIKEDDIPELLETLGKTDVDNSDLEHEIEMQKERIEELEERIREGNEKSLISNAITVLEMLQRKNGNLTINQILRTDWTEIQEINRCEDIFDLKDFIETLAEE